MNDKLIDLLIEWSESGMFLSDLNVKLKKLSSSGCAEHDVCTTSEEEILSNYKRLGELMREPRSDRDTNVPIKEPWMPKPGDGYWIISNTYDEPMKRFWGNPNPTIGELALWKLGLVFRTEEEAVAKITSLLKK